MLILILFAFLAGIVTVLSPCILPVLPVVLSGSTGGGKSRPWGIITGFIISFTFFTLTLSAIVQWFGLSPDILRWVAATVVLLFGLIMVAPPLKMLFGQFASRMLARSNSSHKKDNSKGFWSGLTLGVSLGLVWTPCVGPIMASVITLALTVGVGVGSVIITVAYSLGTSIPLFLIMKGGRGLLQRFPFFTRNSEKIQKVFGVLMIITAISLITGLDRQFQSFVLDAIPDYGKGLTAIENNQLVRNELDKLEGRSDTKENQTSELSYDSLPLGGPWINSPELSPEELKGKVVLIDFWTYSCINCIRTLPYLKAWDEKYREKGLVIIGVHSPEFSFEQVTENVKSAVKDFEIKYPVVQDNEFKIWRAFSNRYWPAHYFFDKSGKMVYSHFGEGEYKKSEMLIQELLDFKDEDVSSKIPSTRARTKERTSETYLGYQRANSFISPEAGTNNIEINYSIPQDIPTGHWALEGLWKQNAESIEALGPGALEMVFRAEKVYLVMEPVEGEEFPEITIRVNNQTQNTIDVKNGKFICKESRLYQLFDSENPVEGVIKIETTGPVRAFAFTFG